MTSCFVHASNACVQTRLFTLDLGLIKERLLEKLNHPQLIVPEGKGQLRQVSESDVDSPVNNGTNTSVGGSQSGSSLKPNLQVAVIFRLNKSLQLLTVNKIT